jgi:hypothetical protein
MAAKAYILTTGAPDERRVIAVFSTREGAEAALRFGDDDTAVEEFALDAPLPSAPEDCSLWHVMDDDPSSAFQLVAFGTDEPVGEVTIQAGSHVVCVWAKDEDHALLLGFEKFRAFKARSGGNGQR